ncbi:MAG: heme ABC transporter permease [Rhizobium sp.]|nr:heme ABC transporter permease [Rhizobium sp.]
MNPVLLWFHQLGSPPVFDRFAARWVPVGFALGLVAMAIGIYGALFVVPADYQQGDSFRILYIHVPAAWMSLFVYALMAFYAAIALVWHVKLCEVLAMACAPIGALFTAVTLATGSIWGKPMWGTWWVWDARLTSVFVLFLMYLGLIALNRAMDDASKAARLSAVLILVGFVNIPIIKFSVEWWNTLHQPASVMRMDGPTIDPEFLWPLLVMAIAFTLLFFTLHLMAMRNEIWRRRIATQRRMAARMAGREVSP